MLTMLKNALGLAPEAEAPEELKPWPLRTSEPPDFDDGIGGFWGNRIAWRICDFQGETFRIVGWKPLENAPGAGSVIRAEMESSWVWFEIVDIDWMRDPDDMFFARLEPIAQQRKGEDRVYFVGEEI